MLEFNSIELEDFGPFKGHQEIELPDEDGVTVVFGENMRGKTMLLNSIRYALFGRVLNRGSREISPEQVINWESREEGKYSFKVTLNFENERNHYELVRMFKPKDGVTEPRGDDFVEEVYLRKNGSVLGPEARDQEISRIMPEQVSRFFLFDGELLQQYEELLVDESDMGRKIREAIERILGLPVLTNGRTDLRELLQEAEKQESTAAQKNNKTQELGNQLENLTQNRTEQQTQLDELNEELEELKEEKSRLQESRRQQEAIRGLVNEKEQLEEDNEDHQAELEDLEQKLKDVMSESWKGVLQGKIQNELSELRDTRNELEVKKSKQQGAHEISSRLETALDEGDHCPFCSQKLDHNAEEHIQNEIKSLQDNDDDSTEVEEKLRSIYRSIGILEDLEAPDPSDQIKSVVTEIDEHKAEIAQNKDRIEEIDDQIDAADQEEVNRLNREYDEVVRKIQIKEDAVSDTEDKIEEATTNIKKLQRQLDQASDHEFGKERRRREIYDDLYELFDDAVDVYRDKLRKRVEEDATRIFLELTTEPEYEGLQINDNYGLTIIHEEGGEIPVRSAGAEHVVALSLMGALQNNAPLQGPIIMDSPFGRLDENHVNNVVEALPGITDQVMLLVYRSELRPEVARDLLKGRLRAEYSLTRESARHTKLVPGGDGNE